MRVLELGPLEGGHTYALEKFGADVLAIESNSDAYLKCLIAKEITGIKARFMLGDVTEFLTSTRERFDLVFACGVLYHMRDPITVIEDISRVTDRCYVWSHVFDETHYKGPPRRQAVRSALSRHGIVGDELRAFVEGSEILGRQRRLCAVDADERHAGAVRPARIEDVWSCA